MTNRKSASKHIITSLLCTIVLLTIFSATSLFASANGLVTSPNSIVPLSLAIPENSVTDDVPYELFKISLTVNNSALGTVDSSLAAAAYGTVIELSAIPISGNRFVRWEVLYGDITLSAPESPTAHFFMPMEDVSISAVFSMGVGIIVGNNIAVHHTMEYETVIPQLTPDILAQIISSETGTLITFDLVRIDDVSSIVLPRAALERISLANFGVEIVMQHGLIALNRQALASVVAQGTGTTVTIYLHPVARTELSETQQHVLSTCDSVYFAQILAGIYTVTSFDGVLTIMVPYSGEIPVGVWRLFSDGRLEDVPSIHDAARLTVSFMPSSPSLFVVGIDHNAVQIPTIPPIPIHPPETLPLLPPDISVILNPFVDVQVDHWFYESVLFVYAHGIMGSTGIDPMTFSPNANLTRGMIVTILHRLEGAPSSTASNPFSDVSENAWYTDAVIWAADAGIVRGVAEGRFDPSANITRQDLAVIFIRYARYTGTSLLPVTLYNNFEDQAAIAAYAVPAVRQAVEAGIMGGTVGNLFAPQDNATRAQTAAMLHRFIGLTT